MQEIIFLTFEQVLTIHDNQIELYGGSHGIHNLSLLESAIMRPQTTFGGQDLYPTLFDKAAALTQSMILNHAFVDGNKRTGMVSTLVFLELNNYRLKIGQKELIEVALEIRHKEWNLKEISFWFKKHSRKI